MNVLCIDLGATSGRVMTINYNDGLLSYKENARFLNRVYRDKNNTLRWDFSYLFYHIIHGIKQAIHDNPNIDSIGIDTWGVDYGLLKTDKLINDPICYRDERTFNAQKEVLEKIPFAHIYQKTGIQNLHFNTIYQLYAEKEELSNYDTLLMIPDLIAFFLTGEKRLEETNASTTSIYNKEEGCIDKELLNKLHIPTSLFPKIIHPGEKYGTLKKEYLPTDIQKEIPVIAVCTHDTGSAILGANGKRPFAYISSGTWSLIGSEEIHPIINEASRKANFTNEIGYASSVRFLKNTMGMFLINEVRNDYKNKGIDIPVQDIVSLVRQAQDLDTYIQVDDPRFETPGDMIKKIENYLLETSQTLPTTPGEMMKVIYQSMALTYRKIILQLEELTHHTLDSILIVGGGNQAEILNQYTADACGIKVITGPSEATVIGNALAQLISLKAISSVEEGREIISRSITSQSYDPTNREEFSRRYQNYLSVCMNH